MKIVKVLCVIAEIGQRRLKMAEKSKIQWTNSSWNPTTGCTKVSEGCANCYAETLSVRLQKTGSHRYRNAFKLTLHPDALNIPLKWKQPKKIFVNSMSDLFHKDIPFEFIDKVWDVMMQADWHTYQILTKRPEIMSEYIERRWGNRGGITTHHIWLGTSVENQKAKSRIDILRKVKAKIRFLSLEPLLEDLGELNLEGIHWVIVGGESGKNHRPFKEEWALNILKQCRKQNVPFFFKQVGGITTKSGGRLLQGKTYDEYPNGGN